MKLIHKTIGSCLEEQTALYGSHTAIQTENWSCTYQEMNWMSDSMAGRLLQIGVEKNVHVGIWSTNSPAWVILFLAIVKLGAIPVLLNTCLTEKEMKEILEYADVRYLFYGNGYKERSYEDMLKAMKEELPRLHACYAMEENKDWYDHPEFAEENKVQLMEQIRCRKAEVRPEDTACMIFTSGTTSVPKGVMLSHYSIVNNARALVEAMHWNHEDCMCITVPLFHCFGLTVGIMSCIMSGMSMYLLPYFKSGAVWDALEQRKCTILNGVPSMFLALVRKKEFYHRKAPALRSGIIAGSPFTKEEYLEICRRFPKMKLQPSYGQTETAPCVSMADWNEEPEQKAASVGKIIPHVNVRICDPETGKLMHQGETGEIEVHGYNVMKGYYGHPEENRRTFRTDGWLRTGDLGYLDTDGKLHINGRRKEMIIRSGENISPQEVEEAIRACGVHGKIKVIGVPAEVLQEEVVACIVPDEGVSVQEEVLLHALEQRLAHYKIPAYILLFKEIPLNASGKTDLKALKEMALQQIQKMELRT